MVTEMYDSGLTEALKFYHAGADMPFNFNLISELDKGASGREIAHWIDVWYDKMPDGKVAQLGGKCLLRIGFEGKSYLLG